VQDEDIYRKISVLRGSNGHILIHDPFYPPNSSSHQYFDIHDAILRIMDQEQIISFFSEISGEQKEAACTIYLHWKYRKNCDFVKTKAAACFPLTGSTPGVYASPAMSSQQTSMKLEAIARANKKVNAIRKICSERKIKQLCHFTHTANLASILRSGLVGQDQVGKLPNLLEVVINDHRRIDGHPEAVCLSISFPNYRMFYPFHQHLPADWVVITLQPEILWELDCAFCKENAASNNVRNIPIDQRKQFEALEELFKDVDHVKRGQLKIPNCYPTNPQAEILVFDLIPASYFLMVYFFDKMAKSTWAKMNPGMGPDILAIGNEYFSARCDYKFWQAG